MKFICSFEINDDELAKAVFKSYTGQTFPVMLTYYDNGTYRFEAYEPESSIVDVTPMHEPIDVVL